MAESNNIYCNTNVYLARISGTNWSYLLIKEGHLCWQFIKGDIAATIIPGLLFMIGAWSNQPSSFSDLLLGLGQGLLYFLLSVVTFCVSNQIIGLEEDRLNKPSRPLVTGAISYRGAQYRWVVSMVLLSLCGWWFGVLNWALLWQVCTILHNFVGFSKHWSTKYLLTGVGLTAELAAAWQLVTPLTPLAWRWLLVLGSAWILLCPVQDLRDITGDRATGRKTIPIVFGEIVSRVMLSVGFSLLPLVIHFALMMPAGNSWNLMLWDLGQAVVSFIIAARIIFYRTPQMDRHTYMLFTYWYCLVLASAIFVL